MKSKSVDKDGDNNNDVNLITTATVKIVNNDKQI